MRRTHPKQCLLLQARQEKEKGKEKDQATKRQCLSPLPHPQQVRLTLLLLPPRPLVLQVMTRIFAVNQISLMRKVNETG